MSRSYIAKALRQLVINRAEGVCEYCLIHENDTFYGCQVDHIISEKHGGLTTADNLAYACTFCNRYKGSDVGSIVLRTGEFSRFFNPRIDQWADHFTLDNGIIVALTDIGMVTVNILDFNNPERLLERQALQTMGCYPSVAALKRMIVQG